LTKRKNCPTPQARPRGAQATLTVGKNIPRATGAQAILKKKPTLPQHHIKSL